MTPHDIELKRYNDLCHRLDLIEETLQRIMDSKEYGRMHKLMNDGIMLCAVYVKDAKALLRKYAERSYDP